jgi:phage terminase large subunit-like protein
MRAIVCTATAPPSTLAELIDRIGVPRAGEHIRLQNGGHWRVVHLEWCYAENPAQDHVVIFVVPPAPGGP